MSCSAGRVSSSARPLSIRSVSRQSASTALRDVREREDGALDLEAQWRGLESNGQWRFTPPTHVLAALDAALDQFDAEGGVPGRFARYSRNCAVLRAGMRELGFTYSSIGRP